MAHLAELKFDKMTRDYDSESMAVGREVLNEVRTGDTVKAIQARSPTKQKFWGELGASSVCDLDPGPPELKGFKDQHPFFRTTSATHGAPPPDVAADDAAVMDAVRKYTTEKFSNPKSQQFTGHINACGGPWRNQSLNCAQNKSRLPNSWGENTF